MSERVQSSSEDVTKSCRMWMESGYRCGSHVRANCDWTEKPVSVAHNFQLINMNIRTALTSSSGGYGHRRCTNRLILVTYGYILSVYQTQYARNIERRGTLSLRVWRNSRLAMACIGTSVRACRYSFGTLYRLHIVTSVECALLCADIALFACRIVMLIALSRDGTNTDE